MFLDVDSHDARLLSTVDSSTTRGSTNLSHQRKKSITYIYGSFTGHQNKSPTLEESRYIYERTKAARVNPPLILWEWALPDPVPGLHQISIHQRTIHWMPKLWVDLK